MDIESLLADFNYELVTYADELLVDEENLYMVEERLDIINHLKTKYGNSISQILKYQKEKQERFAVLSDYENYLAGLQQEYDACEASLTKLAKQLGRTRKTAAVQFADAVKQALAELNFLDVRFELRFQTLEHFTANGTDEVCFMISTNPGQPLRPVQDTASGGELSRIMLAVKAVMADVHFVIEKNVTDGETQTAIRKLKEEESIVELARILGGAQITQTVLDSAREMKELAVCTKKY